MKARLAAARNRQALLLFGLPAALLVLALAPLPYAYYTFLRVAVCLAAILAAVQPHETTLAKILSRTMVVLAVLYNPVFPVHLERPIWAVINIATAVIFLFVDRVYRGIPGARTVGSVRGVPLRSVGMDVRRTLASFGILSARLPSHWHYSPAEMHVEIDRLSGLCRENEKKWSSTISTFEFRSFRQLARLCLSESPDHLDAWRVLGYCALKLERHEEATAVYRLLSKIFRDRETYTALGDASQDDEERIAAYLDAARVDQNDPWPWLTLGSAYAGQRRYKESVASLETAIALQRVPDSPTLFELGMSQFGLGHHRKAMATFLKALKIDKIHAFREFYDVQLADMCVGHQTLALELFRHARHADPKAADLFLNMYARRQIAADSGVWVSEVDQQSVDEAVASFRRV